MQLERQVLDHGLVRLVSFMQPAAALAQVRGGELCIDSGWSGDLEIVRNARVSYNADWRTGQDEGSDAKLVHSMTSRAHTSPFESMVFTFEIEAPIFVLRQWHRHRTWSYNEQSARYQEVDAKFYIPAIDQICGQHETDKQMRSNSQLREAAEAQQRLSDTYQVALHSYKAMLRMGVARELARCCLPVATYSRMFATVDLHNLKHFLTLRQDAHAQYEIRVYADAIHDLVSQVVPVAMMAFHHKREAETTLRELGVRISNVLAESTRETDRDLGQRLHNTLRALGVKT